MSRDSLCRLWPLFGLRLATPRLVLRPLSDDDLAELVDLVLAGVHDPSVMPFAVPWTDAPRDVLIEATLRFHWNARVASVPTQWAVHFGVRSGGMLLGTEGDQSKQFRGDQDGV
ncbi:MAG: GNAT family N-acetyltransferase, partial [Actinomycetota bacterium]|nr:GNAT family N-acetyltransferase [Actinomycetota bacterium]